MHVSAQSINKAAMEMFLPASYIRAMGRLRMNDSAET
jgi:hypothetical protein